MATRPIRDANLDAPSVTTGGWNRRIRRFNRAVLNPLMLRVADRVRGTYPAVVHHVGRRSGRAYRTPVVARPIAGGFVIPLPYGVDTDWCRNARAADHFSITRAGETTEVGDLEVIGAAEALPLVDERARRSWQRLGIERFLRVRAHVQDEHRPEPPSGWG